MKRLNLIHRKFGKLTVLSEHEHRDKGRHVHWLCRCDCGEETIVSGSNLVIGKIQSCGCLGRIKTNSHKITHGLSKHPLHKTWDSMKQRCNNPNNKHFRHYGAKGIKVCEEWEHDFLAFYLWAEDNGYKCDLTLDRINNDKGYSPDNCRYVTCTVNNQNKTDTLLTIEKAQEIRILRLSGLKYKTIADLFRVSTTTVANVVSRKRWKNAV